MAVTPPSRAASVGPGAGLICSGTEPRAASGLPPHCAQHLTAAAGNCRLPNAPLTPISLDALVAPCAPLVPCPQHGRGSTDADGAMLGADAGAGQWLGGGGRSAHCSGEGGHSGARVAQSLPDIPVKWVRIQGV